MSVQDSIGARETPLLSGNRSTLKTTRLAWKRRDGAWQTQEPGVPEVAKNGSSRPSHPAR